MPFSSLKRGGGRGQGWWDKRLRTYFNTADYVWNSVTQGLDYFYGVMPLSFSLSLSLLDQVFSTEKKERQKSLWVRLDSVKFPEDWNFVSLTSLRYSNIRIWRFKIYIGIKMDVLKRNAYSRHRKCLLTSEKLTPVDSKNRERVEKNVWKPRKLLNFSCAKIL